MSSPLHLLVDECLAAGPLVNLLRSAGHDVVTSIDVFGTGVSDTTVFEHGKRERRAILTFDCGDFAALHQEDAAHSGILLVYQDGDSRDMTYREIAIAVDHAVQSCPDGLAGHLIVLNHFRRGRHGDYH